MDITPIPDQTVTTRRNRQPSKEKHEAILEAAIDLFSEHGYAATSVDAIAAEAGVAKQTVYHHFGNKNALLEAAICRVTTDIVEPLDEIETARRPLREVLTQFAERVIDLTMTPQAHRFVRLLIGETGKPEHGPLQTFNTAISRTNTSLARYLRDQSANGRIAIEDSSQAAQLFMGMLVGDLRFRGLLGILPELDTDTRDRHVRATVGVFLRAFAPPHEANAANGE